LGQKEAGDKELAAYLGQRGKAADPWPARVAEFLLGRISESDLMAAAASPDASKEREHRAEGWYYAGMKRLLSGDKTGAADCFRKCVAMNRKSHVNHYCAQAELKALGQ
jgi:lipoprotein NlpI